MYLVCLGTGVNEGGDRENENGICLLETSVEGSNNTQEII